MWEGEPWIEQIRMAKFSVGREEDSEGPSSPRPKKQRTTCSQSQDQGQQIREAVQYEVEEEVESECGEEGEEERESEHAEEEEEEVEEREAEYAEEDAAFEAVESHWITTGLRLNGDRPSAGSSGDGSIFVTLTDPDVLDCPICLEPLSSPVFQCENGHVACSCCCIKLGNKCPSCSWPIGYNRCRAIEKVIESVKISCLNIKYGCNETVSYNKKHDHEKTCTYAPCSCPLSECNFIGSSKDLLRHFSIKHSNSAKGFQYDCLLPIDLGVEQGHLILQEKKDHSIFILNNGVEILGNVVNVIRIGPSSTERGCAYDLIARKGDTSVRLQTFTESMPRWVEHLPLERFLLVPGDFLSYFGKLKLELCIHPEAPALTQ